MEIPNRTNIFNTDNTRVIMGNFKENTTYFLFGSDAIRIFEEGDRDEKTMTGLKLGDIEYTVCKFVQNSSDPESLLSDFSGWQDFLVITKEQYEFLK